MAKKSRRTRTRQASTEAAVQTQPQERTTAEVNGKTVDFSKEYHYVISDLRNMAMLAVVMLAVLVGLSFIVQ